MAQRSRLHVPHPPARPGEKPDFSYLTLSPAGAVARPDAKAPAREIENLGREMVRVLDDDGRAVGSLEPAPGAGGAAGRAAAHAAHPPVRRPHAAHAAPGPHFLLHEVDRRGGRVGGAGHGAAARRHAVSRPTATRDCYIVRGRSLVDLMCQCLSNTRDMCKGRQMPIMYHWGDGQHLLDLGQSRHAVPAGRGLGDGRGHQGRGPHRRSWIGEGSSAEADFHHAHDLRRRVSGAGDPQRRQQPVGDLDVPGLRRRGAAHLRGSADRATACPGSASTATIFLRSTRVTQWAAERARQSGGPTLIEHVTYRAAAHSTSDDPSRYRPKEEWQAWPLGDPIARLKQHLIALGEWSEERHAALEKELEAHVTACWKEAASLRHPHRGAHARSGHDVRGCLQARCRRTWCASARSSSALTSAQPAKGSEEEKSLDAQLRAPWRRRAEPWRT